MKIREAIASSYLAEGLTSEGIDLLEAMAERAYYADGEEIVREEAQDSRLMILAAGKAEIHAICDEPISLLQPGMPFGEISLIDERPRSATVKSIGATEVIVLPGRQVHDLLDARPDIAVILFRNLARVLCRRVRSSNRQLAALLTAEEFRSLHRSG